MNLHKQSHRSHRSPRPVVHFVTMAVTLLMLVASATAWLSANRITQSDGVQMTVAGTSNLVIAKGTGIITDSYTAYKVTFDTNDEIYVPATHWYADELTAGSNLLYVDNPQDIDPDTGLAGEDDDGTPYEADLVEVPLRTADDTVFYYRDFNVFIASAGGELDDMDLSVRLKYDEEALEEQSAAKALTVDFYWHGPNSNTYELAGSLNLACLDNRFPEDFSGLDEITIFTGKIPACTAGEIAVRMRVYYDGGLLNEEGIAYVRSGDLTEEKFSFGITFEAVPHDEPYVWWPLEE